MDHLVSDFVGYYREERPHQSKDNAPLVLDTPPPEPKKSKRKNKESKPDTVPISQIDCRQRLGGVIKHYYRKAS
jgi:putative transposase